ncbi:MAG TPA: AAA family ATPase [Actinomycetes bacterium]|nr:AAA family ATPase [Actinomycetes bacterium]
MSGHGGALACELRAERAQLARARACLAEMRRRAESLDATGGDEIAEEVVRARLRLRVAALADDGTVPLFFGRIDYDEAAELADEAAELAGERFHIGRRHIHDDLMDPVVVDWRASVARPFYRASPQDPWGLWRRRRFGFSQGELTSFQDEHFEDDADLAIAEAALRAEIERPRVGPMRDIVATIQPEQDDLVRASLGETICIQGGPGTGKTAVGLHRAAYLLYEHRDRLRTDDVLVVGPSRAFMAFISQVLPGLGEVDVTQRTIGELVGGVTVRGTDTPAAAAVKADARMAEVLRRAVYSRVRLPAEPLAMPFGSSAVWLPASRLRAMVAALRDRGVPYAAARELLWEQLGRACQTQAERGGHAGFESIDDAVKAARRSKAARRLVDAAWPALQPARLLFDLLGDEEALRAAAGGVLGDVEQKELAWARRPRSRAAAPWTAADAFLLDELAALLDAPRSYGHVVVDEAQDLSAMQLRALGRRCRYGSATLLGDLAQGTTPWAVDDWGTALAHLGKPEGEIRSLPRAFRAPRAVLDLANRLLPHIAPGLTPARSVREVSGALELRQVEPSGLAAAWVRAVRDALRAEGSVGVIAADGEVDRVAGELRRHGTDLAALDRLGQAARVTVVPASQAKGLEYDQVVVVEPAAIVQAEPLGLRRLYIVLSRAVTHLTVVHAEPLPALLAGPAGSP